MSSRPCVPGHHINSVPSTVYSTRLCLPAIIHQPNPCHALRNYWIYLRYMREYCSLRIIEKKFYFYWGEIRKPCELWNNYSWAGRPFHNIITRFSVSIFPKVRCALFATISIGISYFYMFDESELMQVFTGMSLVGFHI